MKHKKRVKRLEKRLAALERRMSAIVARLESSKQFSAATGQQESIQSKELACELARVRGKVEDLAAELGGGR